MMKRREFMATLAAAPALAALPALPPPKMVTVALVLTEQDPHIGFWMGSLNVEMPEYEYQRYQREHEAWQKRIASTPSKEWTTWRWPAKSVWEVK